MRQNSGIIKTKHGNGGRDKRETFRTGAEDKPGGKRAELGGLIAELCRGFDKTRGQLKQNTGTVGEISGKHSGQVRGESWDGNGQILGQ